MCKPSAFVIRSQLSDANCMYAVHICMLYTYVLFLQNVQYLCSVVVHTPHPFPLTPETIFYLALHWCVRNFNAHCDQWWCALIRGDTMVKGYMHNRSRPNWNINFSSYNMCTLPSFSLLEDGSSVDLFLPSNSPPKWRIGVVKFHSFDEANGLFLPSILESYTV